MKGFVAIFRREFQERHRILYAAAVASLIPFVVPMFHRLGAADVASLRGGLALVIAAAFALGLPFGLGLTAIVPRIVSRRIGFDLARPVSTSAIWFGTLAATVSLALASAVIVGTPAWFAGAKGAWVDLSSEPAAPIVLVSLLVVLPGIFGLYHALAVVLRSRSAPIALDAAALLLAIVGARAALARLPFFSAADPRIAVLVGLTCAAIVALVAGGSASVARGRTDLRAAHRALSTVLWSVLLVAVLAANSYAAWVLAATPQSLVGSGLWVRAAPSGPWIQLSGRARGADARFVYATSSGRFARAQTPAWAGPAFSRDGRRAAWIEPGDWKGPFPVRTWRLDDPKATPLTTRLTLPRYPSLMELSEDGSRFATWADGVLAIDDVDAQRRLMSARLDPRENEWLSGTFVNRSVFRVIRSADRSIDLLEADVSARTLALRARIAGFEKHPYVSANSDFGRIAILDEDSGKIGLYEGSTGRQIAVLPETPADSRRPFFVADGRLIVSEKLGLGTNRSLRVFSADGEALRSIPLPSGAMYRGGEVAPGQLCVAIGDPTFHYDLWLVNLDDGSLRKVADGLRPIFFGPATSAIGSDATKLFFAGTADNSLVRFDPLTGERRTLIGQP